MTLRSDIIYNNPANFTFDNTKNAISGSDARLITTEIAATTLEDFSNSAGFVFDNTKLKFGFLSGMLLHSEFATDQNASNSIGVNTGVLSGSASVSSGSLLLPDVATSYLDYGDILNIPQDDTGSVRILITTNYSGIPTANRHWLAISEAEGNINSRISVFHSTVLGQINWSVSDDSGVLIASGAVGFEYLPVAATEFELQFSWDTLEGDYRVFIDGVLLGSLIDGPKGNRSTSALLRLGKDYLNDVMSPINGPDCSFSTFTIFSTVQNTSNYTPLPFVPNSSVEGVDRTPKNSLVGMNFDAFLSNWDKRKTNLFLTQNGTPVINPANNLECYGLAGVSTSYRTLARETFKILYTPNYSGAPGGTRNIFSTVPTGAAFDRLLFTHNSAGDTLRLYLRNSSNSTIFSGSQFGPSNVGLNAGQTYEFEVTVDSILGRITLFIDGVLYGFLNPGPFSRGGINTTLQVGAEPFIFNVADARFQRFIVFKGIQHTVDYAPGYVFPRYRYDESTLVVPPFTPASNLVNLTRFEATTNGGPRFVMNGLYHPGSWVASDNSYVQSEPGITVNYFISSLPVSGLANLPITITFNNSESTLNWISSFGFDFNRVGPFFSEGFILHNSPFTMAGLANLQEIATIVGTDSIGYIIVIGTVSKYFDGTDWVNSNNTLAQSNTLTVVLANSSSLPLSGGASVQIGVVLSSADGTTTPILVQNTVTYNYAVVIGCNPSKTVIFGCILDSSGHGVEGAKISVNGSDFFYTEPSLPVGNTKPGLISRETSTFTDSKGEWSLEVVETTTDTTTVDFTIEYSQNGKTIKNKYTGLTIPIVLSVPLGNLVNP